MIPIYVNLLRLPSGVLMARPASSVHQAMQVVLSDEQSAQVLEALAQHNRDVDTLAQGYGAWVIRHLKISPMNNTYLTIVNNLKDHDLTERLVLVLHTYSQMLEIDLGAVELHLLNQSLADEDLYIPEPKEVDPESYRPLPWED